MSSPVNLNDVLESLQTLNQKVDALSQAVESIDRKVNLITNHNQPTHTRVEEENESTNKMTPGESHYRNNRSILLKLLNDIIKNKSTRKQRTLRVLQFTDDQPGWQSLSQPLNDKTLDGVVLTDSVLSLPYEAVCAELEIQPIRSNLSRISTAAVKSLHSLCYQSEKKVQCELQNWIEASASVDTSNSAENLPLFKFAENGIATATAKPDVTCLVLPIKLEIKDTTGNHGDGLIDKEYEVVVQMFERVLSDVGHNELLKTCACFGCSGRYGWLLVMKGKLFPHGESSAILEQTFSLMKVDVADIVPLWEQLISQNKGNSSYYLYENLFGPIEEILWRQGLHPAWCRLKVSKRGSNSMVFNIHVADKHSIRVDSPDLCVKVFLTDSYEVNVLNDINEQCKDNPLNPVRYVISTLTMTNMDYRQFIDNKFLLGDYLRNRQTAPVLGLLSSSSTSRDYWWSPHCSNRPGSSAVLMFYGETYNGLINSRVQQILTDCLSVVHTCGYLHTDIRRTNWLFFGRIPSIPPEHVLDEDMANESHGTVLLIDYDQAVKKFADPYMTQVETKPGQRRTKMLDVTFGIDTKNELQNINWSPNQDLNMLFLMLRDCINKPVTSVPGDLSQSFNSVTSDRNRSVDLMTKSVGSIKLNDVKLSVPDPPETFLPSDN